MMKKIMIHKWLNDELLINVKCSIWLKTIDHFDQTCYFILFNSILCHVLQKMLLSYKIYIC
jgi:hypothetical protein